VANKGTRAGRRPRGVFALRLGGAVAASVAFGLIAAAGLAQWNFWSAVGLGFLFGTAFVGGTGYRIIIGVVRAIAASAPASWSGATAGAALYAIALWAVLASLRLDAGYVLLAFGIAINIAYLPVKLACFEVGCCRAAHGLQVPSGLDLRLLEIGMTVAVLLAGGAAAMVSTGLGGPVATGGHLLVRLVSRRLRDRWSWRWLALRQPGIELAPLSLVLALSIVNSL
jgi:hypothetical protein